MKRAPYNWDRHFIPLETNNFNKMNKLSILVVLALTLYFTGNLKAQSLSDILKRHFEAAGQQKLNAARTFHVKASVSQMGMELPMEMKVKKPGKFRVEIEMQGQKMIQAYNGKTGWMIVPWLSTEPQALAGDQLQQAMQQADMEGELYNYEAKGNSVDFIGKVNLEGAETYKIKLVDKTGNAKNYFIDAKTNLVVMVKAKVKTMGQEVEIEQKMSGYKIFSGINVATKIETKTPMGIMIVTMQEFSLDEEFDNALFDRPEK